jgi:threonine/homoserine/homoserine lactone efflux protein
MDQVVGELLPYAVGVAISPVPIIAVILMLLAAKPLGASSGFLLGWVAGIAAVTTVVVVLAGTQDVGSTSEPSSAVSWVKLVLGLLLLLLAVREWRSRPAPGDDATLPKWMAAIDHVTPVKACGLGFVLSAANPKNLLMCIAAGTAIAGGDLSFTDAVLAVLLFTVLAASTVAVPVAAYAIGRDRMLGTLESLRTWLTLHSAAVMSTLLLVIGVVLLGKGLGGLL